MFNLRLLKDKSYRLYIYIFLIIVLVTSWTNFGHNTGDEYSQIFEFAAYKLGYVNHSDLRLWEFDSHMRPSIQVWMVVAVYKIVGLFMQQVNPFVVNYIIYVFSGLLSLLSIILFIELIIEEIKPSLRKSFVIFSLFSWLVLYSGIHFNSDNICGKFFIIGLFLLLQPKIQYSYFKMFIIGLCFAMSFACRFQMGFAIASVMFYLTWQAYLSKKSFIDIIMICVGILLGIVVFNIIADYYFYGSWVFSPYMYYYNNIATGNMDLLSGVSPWYTYFAMTSAYLPFGPVYIIASLYYIYKNPKSIYSVILVSYSLTHILIGHKEVRFLMPMLVFMPLTVFILVQDMLLKINWFNAKFNTIVKIFWVINLFMYLSLLIPAATEIGGWRFLYNNYTKQTVIYYNFNEAMTLLYYKKNNVKLVHLDGTDNLTQLTCPDEYNCLLALRDNKNLGKVDFPLVYTFFPLWLYNRLPLDISQVVGHFNVYEIRTIEK